jgi:hypothetical protein
MEEEGEKENRNIRMQEREKERIKRGKKRKKGNEKLRRYREIRNCERKKEECGGKI